MGLNTDIEDAQTSGNHSEKRAAQVRLQVIDPANARSFGEGQAFHSVRPRASFTRSDAWTIEDEQCQKIGGGYEAVKFRFLLFL